MIVGIRELSRDTSRIIQEFERTGEPVIVTREGLPIGALVAVDQQQLQDLVLATAPEFIQRRRHAEEEVRAGQTRSVQEVAAERGIELPAEADADAGLSELALDSTTAKLRPLEGLLAPQVMRDIEQEVAGEVATVSAEMVEHARRAPGADLDRDDVREVVELNASISAEFVKQELSAAVTAGEPDVQRTGRVVASVGERLRSIASHIETGSGVIPFLVGFQSGSELARAEPAEPESSPSEMST